MARPRIYVDLDETMVAAAWPDDPEEADIVAFLLRPGIDPFLAELAEEWDAWVLTSSNLVYAREVLAIVDPHGLAFGGLITDEDLRPVEAALESGAPVRPIAPPGPVIDNMPSGSDCFRIKAAAVGVGAGEWVRIEPFERGRPDRDGLAEALREARRRLGR